MDENKIVKSDPLLYLLNVKLKLSPIIVAIVFLFFSYIMVPWAMYSGVWNNIDYSLKMSYSTWIGNFIISFAVMLILNYYKSIPNTWKKLASKKILFNLETIDNDKTNSDSSNLNDFTKKWENRYTYWPKTLFAVIISIGTSYYFHYLFLKDGLFGWTELSATGGWSVLGYYHIIFFAIQLNIVVIFFTNIIITIQMFRDLKKKVLANEIGLNWQRLCQYNSGGLKPLGDLVVQGYFIIFMIGTVISLLVLYSVLHFNKYYDWQIIQISVLIPLYIISSILLFIYHLKPIHILMKYKKEELYNELSKYDNNIITLEKFTIKKLFSSQETRDNLKINKDIFELINELPTWPFDTRVFIKIVPISFLPLIPIIYQSIIELFL